MRLSEYTKRYGEFVGHVFTLMSGKTIAATIALIATPVVARLFDPSDFGVAASFMATIGIVSNVGTLCYMGAVILPKSDEEALAVMTLCYRVLFSFCIAMLVLIAAYPLIGLEIEFMALLGPWAWALPIGVLLATGVELQLSWLSRIRAYRAVSVALVTGTALGSGSRILLGSVLGTSVYGLIIGNLLGTTLRLFVQGAASLTGVRSAFSRLAPGRMWSLIKQYSDFPKYNAPAIFIFSIGQNLPVLLFGVMFSSTVAGLYAMANRLAQAPVTIVANSMRQVFRQKAATIHNEGRSLRKAFLLSVAGLAALGAIPFSILWVYGQPLLLLLLGDRWADAGLFLEIIAPWLFMIWVTAPCNAIYLVLRRNNQWLWLQTNLTLARLAAFGIAYLISAGPEGTLRAFVIATIAGNLLTISMTLRLIRISDASGSERSDAGRDLGDFEE